MPTPIQLLIDAEPNIIAHYRVLLEALDPSQQRVTCVDELAQANAVLLADGASLAPEALAERPCLLAGVLAQQGQWPNCVACIDAPVFDSLLEGLGRLGSILDGAPSDIDHGLVASSPAMQELTHLLAQVADKSVTVLINGPSGAGKELVAQAIHRLSSRSSGPFVPINCGAIPRELLESELFGHERGAFTGAISSRAGRFELADGGTLFLDEIGDMPLDMQVKILRAIQERSFERVGSSESRSADVRIIAATHRDLPAMIDAGEFREDLYYRLNVFPLQVPALSERKEDIPALVRDIIRQLADDGLGTLVLAPSAVASLQAHHWAGNVRELANLLERLLIMYPDKVVGRQDLPEVYRGAEVVWQPPARAEVRASAAAIAVDELPVEGVSLKEEVADFEQRRIQQALRAADHVVSRAAQLLGLRRTTLIEKMRKYGMSADV
jgi:sigma-54 specific flagellar transcriptional regulator A